MILPSTAVKRATTTHAPAVLGRLRRIEGRHNALVKELRAAFAHGELTPDGYCAIEGMRILEEAIRSGLKFKAVFFRTSAENRAERLLPQLAAHVETLLLPDKLFASAVPSETPQGVAALVRCKPFKLEDVLAKAKAGPLLAIAGVQDPGNLGTILRSAEAFGAGGVLLGEGTVSPFNSKVIRASAGSVFRLPIVQTKLAGALNADARTRPSPRRNFVAQRHSTRPSKADRTVGHLHRQRRRGSATRTAGRDERDSSHPPFANRRVAERGRSREHRTV